MTQWVDFKTVREHLSFHDVLAHYGIDEHGNGDQIKIICPFHGLVTLIEVVAILFRLAS